MNRKFEIEGPGAELIRVATIILVAVGLLLSKSECQGVIDTSAFVAPHGFFPDGPSLVQGRVQGLSGDTLRYKIVPSLQRLSPFNQLRPDFKNGYLKFYFTYSSALCNDNDINLLIVSDTILVNRLTFGGCIKSLDRFSFSTEINGLKKDSYVLKLTHSSTFGAPCTTITRQLAIKNLHSGISSNGGTANAKSSLSDDEEILKSGGIHNNIPFPLLYELRGAKVKGDLKSEEEQKKWTPIKRGVEFGLVYESNECDRFDYHVLGKKDTIFLFHQNVGSCKDKKARYEIKGRFLTKEPAKYVFVLESIPSYNLTCDSRRLELYKTEFETKP